MNGIFIIDKPEGWTSQDVCAKLRGVFKERRIGHGGTLDPMATGVLPVFAGRATRAVEFCENTQKRYIAELRTGLETDTQDITGTVLKTFGKTSDFDALLSVLPEFLGKQRQIPPMYSAVKIGGKKLYELARRGEQVERAPRDIEIFDLTAENLGGGNFKLDITCSKGTYIRTLCADIGARLGTGGVMAALRRVRTGAFNIEDAFTIEDIIEAKENGALESVKKTVDSLFISLPAVTISGDDIRRCRNGNEFKSEAEDGEYRVYGETGEFLMVGRCSDGIMSTVKSFFEV